MSSLLVGNEDPNAAPAWGYVAPPAFYPHAGAEWRSRLEMLAIQKGFRIERWFSDQDGRADGLSVMWTMLPNSGVRALFMPHPTYLTVFPRFKGMSVQEIKDQLPIQLFLLDGTFASITPPSEPPVNILREPAAPAPTSRRRRRFLLLCTP